MGIKKGFFCYSARPTYAAMPRPSARYNRRKWQLINWQELVVMERNAAGTTPQLQSTTPGLHPVSIQQVAPPVRGSKYPITAYYSVYRRKTDEWLSWPSWLTCSGRFTHINTNRLGLKCY